MFIKSVIVSVALSKLLEPVAAGACVKSGPGIYNIKLCVVATVKEMFTTAQPIRGGSTKNPSSFLLGQLWHSISVCFVGKLE